MSRRVRFRSILSIAAALVLASGVARAAGPSTAECLAASESANSLSNQHKLRAERTELLVCASASCPAAVRNECARLVDEVNVAIPTVIFAAKDSAGADLTAVKVTMDHEVLSYALDGTALPVDPGIHAFTFEVGGQRPFTKNLVIRQGERDRHELVTLEAPPAPHAEPAAVATAPGPASKVNAGMPGQEPAPAPGHGMGTQRILAIAAAGVAVVGVGVGTAFGLMALSKRNDARSACPNQCATQDGVSKWNDAAAAGNISTVAFLVGGAALVGAGILWFTAPRRPSRGPSARLGVGPGLMEVQGSW